LICFLRNILEREGFEDNEMADAEEQSRRNELEAEMSR